MFTERRHQTSPGSLIGKQEKVNFELRTSVSRVVIWRPKREGACTSEGVYGEQMC
jgi:hypothetical protein